MGYWGEAGTTVTWKNPTKVPEGQRQSGGWYYNPDSNRVDRWWSGDQPQQQSSGGAGGSAGCERLPGVCAAGRRRVR